MRSIAALVGAVGLLAAGLVAVPPAPAGQAIPPAGAPVSLGEIAVVPLDDRPFPAVTPLEIAAAGGHTAIAPPTDDLGEFFTYGDADAVGQWWLEAAAEADASVVALPMLAYGGLVASRACGTDLETARERLSVLEEVKTANPDRPVYAFDVIQRLTIEPTSGYPGSYSGPVRRWAELMDQVENLGMEELRAEYEQVAASIPEEIRTDYLCARARNHQINQDMIHAAADGTIDFLVLGQDDASAYGPHRAEKERLAALIAELGVGDRVKIYPGADVLGALLTAKLVVERLGVDPSVAVEWSRTPGEEWTAPYQDIPYGDLVNEYITTLGAVRSDTPDADVLLMANTSGAGSLHPFVDRISAEVAHGRLVAIGDDAVAGVVDPELMSLVSPRIDLAELGGWSGWNVGISLSQSVVRAALLEAGGTLRAGEGPRDNLVPRQRAQVLTGAAAAHQRLLLEELIHTDLYRNNVRAAVRQYAVDHGDDPQYMTQVFEGANALAVQRTDALAEALFAEEFAGVSIRLGSDGRREHTAVVSAMAGLDLRLGWPRYQELDVFPDVVLTDEPPADPVTLALLPARLDVRPGEATSLELTAVLRNDTAARVTATLAVAAPEGWATPTPASVRLEPFQVFEVPVEVTTAELTPDSDAAVELSLTPRGGTPVTTTATVSAAWRNVALASSGASVTASGYWNQYSPDRAIDGNSASTASRWITAAGPAHWLEVRFAAPEPVDTVDLYQYGGYLLTDYTLSALVDGTWQDVVAVTGNTEVAPQHTFETVVATALRLEITGTRDGQVRLYELEATCRTAGACG
ncbi:DUF4127 family protein [Occultella glacieicola]|uniref:DUF4127 family protein n=1 Tax=Occultella glacieicola TaxID=2518684 RepID=A0ABY2E1Z6_9MICO|nr:DUF4127 family protein [Occultella glacieicola]TDE92624.1 DUF4127 family protein [Occultella glacieicola]